MKITKGLNLVITFMLIVFISFGSAMDVNAAGASLSKKSVKLEAGKTVTLKVNGTKKTVKWSSSNKKVATVSQKGRVKALKKGSATIYARVAGKKLKCKVTVKAKKPAPLSTYWAPDSVPAENLRNYVAKVTNSKDTENYIPEKDRIAVFDMDGTLT